MSAAISAMVSEAMMFHIIVQMFSFLFRVIFNDFVITSYKRCFKSTETNYAA